MKQSHTSPSTSRSQSSQTHPSQPADTSANYEGLIIDGSRGMYRVETSIGLLICTIRGRLRKELEYPESANGRRGAKSVKVKPKDPVAVGDRVMITPTSATTGVIEAVIARSGGAFTRGDPDYGSTTSVAGIDQLIVVFAARDPEPHLRLLDRFIVVAESQAIALTVCLNKTDLGIADWLADRLRLYTALGYPVVQASAATGNGLEALRALIAGKVSALVGPSGVGKSSLLNALEPGLGQRVSHTSEWTGKGRHTTTGTRMVPLTAGGYLADTAGIRALSLQQLDRPLDQCFREFRPLLGSCRHRDCAHLSEPGCAVRDAVQRGAIDHDRYVSYVRLTGAEEASGTADTHDGWEEIE